VSASVAVKLPGAPGTTIVSVCSCEVDAKQSAHVLCSNYNKLQDATELVIMGDFECFSPSMAGCKHGVLNGERLADCLAESFETFEDYEITTAQFPHVSNYLFKDSRWWSISVHDGKLKYSKLIKTRKKNNAKTK